MEAAKAQPEVKDGYMYFSDILEEEKEKAAAAAAERGRSEGIAIGEERGFTAGAEQTARNMLARGYDAAEVAEITGLSPERVRELEEAGDC